MTKYQRTIQRVGQAAASLLLVFLTIVGIVTFSACESSTVSQETTSAPSGTSAGASGSFAFLSSATTGTDTVSLTDIPEFTGVPYVEIDNNVPSFTDSEKNLVPLERYSPLDSLGRCGEAFALIGTETMPSEERGPIGMIKPSGWQIAKYDFVDGKYLYNRCHLIGYQLAGENANEKNLITGTRFLNIEGMLPFENGVANYVEKTHNHVLYRVTPIFVGNELVARGVQIEGYSVEDKGAGVNFNVFCYNAQPKVTIDYATGENHLTETKAEEKANGAETAERRYVLNTNTMRFHDPDCPSVEDIAAHNRRDFIGTRDELIDKGYQPCGRCNPQ